ncbi:MAG: hemagglutinin [Bifidobacterium mongoliense]|uniref:Hemagglutinin n=3 Tax=Bifidobacterium mongoliense TaxID=518643 RepID=A0A087BUW3_9BIFI|nr:hypothetical protein [Bifidobacterium mongoliense]KFI74813.1 hemagglutinin [Bifidobacterium mongoliense DSM 21395]MDN5632865.1 hemagglutinin [Bifidobacterium mongoliense]MDN5979490.1 hemagglutinin [Bifidobacterium mongoliense]MDN6024686.1 hemagglutinin [Bifidobacterium mongoliense]MDN6051245.1 hemagglutinin [Bifidobacterium mongoliense]
MTGLIGVIAVMALIMGAIRLAQWQVRVNAARTEQQQLQRTYDFNPGNIIADGQFFNANAMSAAEVQAFLDDQGASCSGSRCLKSMRFPTEHRDADQSCREYRSTGEESAADIIDKSAKACGISQKVLLTMLQKEQHLVSADWISDFQIKAAMGLSCPDDASCDPRYAGFFRQVFGAAQRLRYYENHEQDYAYHAGTLNRIAYHPNAACSASDVYIENKATALLYIYTPYQPNAAALQANGGEGDSCSSYGNRNFSIIYQQWFGSPRR